MSDADDRRLDSADGGKAPDAGRSAGDKRAARRRNGERQGASERHAAPRGFPSGRWNETGVSRRASSPGGSRTGSSLAVPFGLIVGGASASATRATRRTRSRAAASRRLSPTRSAMPRVPPTPTRGGSSRSECPFSSGRVSRVKAIVARAFARLGRASSSRAKPAALLCSRGACCAWAIITVALSAWFADVAWHGLPGGRAHNRAAHRAMALGFDFTFRTGTLPGGRRCPAQSSSGSESHCSAGLVDAFLVDELAKSTLLYGGLGAATTLIFSSSTSSGLRRQLTGAEQLALRRAPEEPRAGRGLSTGSPGPSGPHETGGLRHERRPRRHAERDEGRTVARALGAARAVTPRGPPS